LARRKPPRQRAIPGSEPSQGFAPSLAALWLDLVATVKPRRMLTQHGCPIAPATYYDDVGRGPTDSPAFTPLIPAAQGHCRASPRAAFEPWFERLGGPSPWGSFWTITPPSPPGVPSQSCVALCALRNTDVGRGWLRVRVGNPACYFCAVWVPGAVGEWRWRWFDVGQLTDGSGCTVEHPNLRERKSFRTANLVSKPRAGNSGVFASG